MMRMKALEALFENQTHRKHMIVQDGDKPDEEMRIGLVSYGVRMTKKEYDKRFPHLPRKSDKSGCYFVISKCSRQHLSLLKTHLFEKYTGAGWPIFQTKKWIKAQEKLDDLAAVAA
jgi:hypothetical protein